MAVFLLQGGCWTRKEAPPALLTINVGKNETKTSSHASVCLHRYRVTGIVLVKGGKGVCWHYCQDVLGVAEAAAGWVTARVSTRAWRSRGRVCLCRARSSGVLGIGRAHEASMLLACFCVCVLITGSGMLLSQISEGQRSKSG